MTGSITRRQLLEGAGAAFTLSLFHLNCQEASEAPPGAAAPAAGAALAVPVYAGWQDVYRKQWTWDKVVKGAHHVINCASQCSFNLFVRDGIVWREEQNTIMEATNSNYPDFNPRGCNKGVCFSNLMYGPTRLQHPLKRAGERGSGLWKRISWDEALTEIADKIIEISVEDGPECVVYDSGTANAGFGSEGSEGALFGSLGSTQLDGWQTVGDMPLGLILTWGLFNFDSTADDYFNSDLVFIWLGNPSVTRIPDAHFFWEARYNGTRIVGVAPDYSPSSIHCDQWLNVRVGTDAALALGMAHVMLAEGLFKADFVKEQTDLPLLVREDNGKFLRQSDREAGGADNVFYLWDAKRNALAEAPGSEGLGRGTTLRLGALDPVLEGSWTVALANGSEVRVRPVFEHLRDRILADYSPEQAAAICGVGAAAIRDLAREFAAAKAVSIFGSWGMMKHHHSDLFQRGIALLLALTGNIGRRGTGIRIGAWFTLTGTDQLNSDVQATWYQKLLMKVFQPSVRDMIGFMRKYESEHMYMNVPALMFLYAHGGLNQAVDKPGYHDANPGIPLAEAMKQCIENEWVPLYPKPGKNPRMLVHTRVNPLRRWPSPQLAREHLWPKLELIVSFNIKMSSTAAQSDIVLPGCGYYERRGIKYAQSYTPYFIVGDKAVEPIGESKNDWEWAGLLARKIQERAREGKIAPVLDVKEKPRDLQRVYERWTHDGRFKPEDDLPFYELAIGDSPATGRIPWQEAVKKGAIRIQEYGPWRTFSNICTDFQPNETMYPGQWFVEHKQPWPTLTGRQQFYIDHDWYLAAGEHMPIHKEPPQAGGNHPLRMVGGHTRWSIHSTFRDNPLMLQMQRGEPGAWVSPIDAAARGLVDNDRIRIFNDEGSCEMLARISPAVQPGSIIVYHAWEPLQFKDWKSNQEPVPSSWKSLHMTEYGQLHYRFLYGGPHHSPRGTTVDVEKA